MRHTGHLARPAVLAAAAVVCLGLGACTLLQRADRSLESVPAAAGSESPDGMQSVAPATEGEAPTSGPDASAAGSGPAASDPIALPDPPGGLAHRAGEVVAVPGGEVVFEGVATTDEGTVATFRVASGNVSGPRLLTPDGQVVGFTTDGDRLRSHPFGDGAAPAADSELVLIVGQTLISFETGTPTG